MMHASTSLGVHKHYLATLAWVKFREMLVQYSNDHYGESRAAGRVGARKKGNLC